MGHEPPTVAVLQIPFTRSGCATTEVIHLPRSRARYLLAMSVNRTRSLLYSLARFLGDYQAVKNGRIAKRLARRAAGRVTGRGLGHLFR
jgi:hypothetical protein